MVQDGLLEGVPAPLFNFDVDEVESASKELERWRRDPGLPLVVEIYLRSWGQDEQRLGRLAGTTERVETLLERWTFHHHQVLPDSPSTLSTSALARLSPGAIYKRLVILLRSVFTLLRTLPAHRLCRAGTRERRVGFTVGYRLHSSLPPAAAPEADAAASRMLRLALAPSETPYGRLRVAVEYRAASAVRVLEQTGTGAAPQIIFDYVGHEAREPHSRWDEGRGFSRSAPRVAFAEEATARGGGSGGSQAGLMSKSLSGPMVAAAGGRGRGHLLPVGSAPVGSSAAYVRTMSAERTGQAAAGAGEPALGRRSSVGPARPGSAGVAARPASHLFPPPASPRSPSRRAGWSSAAAGVFPGGTPPSGGGAAAAVPPPRSPFQTAVAAQAPAEAGSLEERPGMSSPVRIPGADQRFGAPAEALGSRRSSDARGASPAAAQPAERAAPSTAAAGGVVARVVEGGTLARSRPGSSGDAPLGGGPSADEDALLLMMAPATVEVALSSSGGAASAARAAGRAGASAESCSPPSFPFAITPSASSLPRALSMGRSALRPLGSARLQGPHPGSTPPVGSITVGSTPRHGSMGSFRRPSWSSSSLRGSGALLGPASGSGPMTVGYSVSPLLSASLEALLRADGTGHGAVIASYLGRPLEGADDASTTSSSGLSRRREPPALAGSAEAPPGTAGVAPETQLSAVRASSTADEDLSLDALPFVLESDGPASARRSWERGAAPAGGAGDRASIQGGPVYLVSGGGWQGAAARPEGAEGPGAPAQAAGEADADAGAEAPRDLDAAVGALVRLLRDAPPLHAGAAEREAEARGALTVGQGLTRLEELAREFQAQSAW